MGFDTGNSIVNNKIIVSIVIGKMILLVERAPIGTRDCHEAHRGAEMDRK